MAAVPVAVEKTGDTRAGRGAAKIQRKTHSRPVQAPQDVAIIYDVPKLGKTLRPFDLTGMPIFLGPRGALDIDHNFAMQFIVPFRLADGTRVLVDYGRVPLGEERSISIPISQHYIEAMVERPEKRSFSVGDNDAEAGKWRYRDVKAMAKHLGTEPLLFKRITRRINPDDIPIASLPKVDVPNRHLEYVFTWYIMAATTYMLGFLKK